MCTLGKDAFEHAPAVIKGKHAYLRNSLNETELDECMMLQLMQDVNTISLDRLQCRWIGGCLSHEGTI